MATAESRVTAWVTLATNDPYAVGALVLARSLRAVNTVHRLAIMVTPGVTPPVRQLLNESFDDVVDVNVLDSRDAAHLALMSRPELGVTLTKIHCWTLMQYSRCCFLDADCLVVDNCDELMEREELSAAPDVGWPDCFNSGVFVFTPSQQTFSELTALAAQTGSFDGGDQGLLNTYFSSWPTRDISRHLSFLYNMTVSSTYTYLPAFKQYGHGVKIVHFLGADKPWTGGEGADRGGLPSGQFYRSWWNIYRTHVQPRLSTVETVPSEDQHSPSTPQDALSAGVAGIQIVEEQRRGSDERDRREAWEHGQPDYMGADSFSNILAKINDTMNGAEK